MIGVGVATGIVATDDLPLSPPASQPLVGDVVTHAHILQAQASPNTVLCDETTAHLVRQVAHLDSAHDLYVPHLADSLRAYPLVSDKSQGSAQGVYSLSSRPPFVGRA